MTDESLELRDWIRRAAGNIDELGRLLDFHSAA